MGTTGSVLLFIALAVVLVTLLMGIVSMVRGGEFNQRHGNRFMRYRVLAQGLALLLLALLFVVGR